MALFILRYKRAKNHRFFFFASQTNVSIAIIEKKEDGDYIFGKLLNLTLFKILSNEIVASFMSPNNYNLCKWIRVYR